MNNLFKIVWGEGKNLLILALLIFSVGMTQISCMMDSSYHAGSENTENDEEVTSSTPVSNTTVTSSTAPVTNNPTSDGTPDTTAPVPGNGGTITTNSVTQNSLTLYWTSATDAVTSQTSLQYAVYRSSSNNINSVTNCESSGTIIQNYTANIDTYNVTGLSVRTTYYFNVIVKDYAGNKAVYTTKQQETESIFVMSGTGGTAGNNQSFTKGALIFNMKYVPGGTFPTGLNDTGTPYTSPQTVSNPYWMAETEVTYELWYAVRTWARANGYTLNGNPGIEGNDGTITSGTGAEPTVAKLEPVTTINWREAMVWCNALTEYFNANNGTDADLDLVYYTNSGYTIPIRTATDTGSVNSTAGSEDAPYVKATAKGFRLPTSMEWECAARYRGSDTTNSILNTGVNWTKGNSASGATDYVYTTAVNPLDTAGETGPSRTVAWYSINSGSATQPVAQKTANALGIRDMSGNVWEWCLDWHPSYVGSNRVMRGGGGYSDADVMQVGYVNVKYPYIEFYSFGFRFARTQ